MKPEEISNVMQPLLDAFPTFSEFYRLHRDSMRPAWIKALAFIGQADATTIIDRLIDGRIPMPRNYEYDRVAILIKQEASDISSKRNERETAHRKYFSSRGGAWDVVKNDRTGHIAVELGAMVKAGTLTEKDNDAMMVELMSWDKGGEVPEWMERMFGMKA